MLAARLLGEGGMACVWLARNLLLDMPVALKLLRNEPALWTWNGRSTTRVNCP